MGEPGKFAGTLFTLALSTALLAPVPVTAATPDNFQAKTTADMVTLCSTDPSAPDYAMAISFCHGFAVGAYQYYAAIAAGDPTARFVCMPNPPPPRSQAIADFVAWARTRNDVMSKAPVDSMFRFLGERYPCPK
ncbi:MAG TPA: Rap1a/Tai family immunity protein [Xanthobacteraceae bacterium]